MNIIQKLAAGAVLSAPIAIVGCHDLRLPLRELGDRLPGGTVFDKNNDGILENRELEMYFRVMLNRPEGEHFNRDDLKEMKKVASNLRSNLGDNWIPANIVSTLRNLRILIDATERNIQDRQDDEIRTKKNKMFPQ